MANVKDHLRRDAEAAVRSEVALQLGQFSRRVMEDAYTKVSERINAAPAGTTINGIELGREAALDSFNRWLPLSNGQPHAAIEGGSVGGPEDPSL